MMELYDHQKRIIEANPSKILLAHSTGTGKTRTAIEMAARNGRIVLVIMPKSLKQKWLEDTTYWYAGNLTHWILATKEEFRKGWKTYYPKCDVLIVDEAHYFFGMTSLLSKSLLAYIKRWNIERIYLLTATPYLSTPFNIFRAAQILGHNLNYMSFKLKFFNEIRMGRRMIPVIKKGAKEEVAKIVRQIGDVVRLEDCVDVPEQIFKTEKFELTKDQEDAMKEITDIMPIVRFTKRHQIENGTLKGDEYNKDRYFKNEKENRIIELAIEFDKLAIFCRYNYQINCLEENLKKEFGKEKEVFIIMGSVKDRHNVINKANESKNCIIIIQGACSEGYELPTFDCIVFASLDFSYKNYKQSLGRFLRINRLKKNLFIHLVAGPIDEAVYNSIMNKQDFDMEIYSKTH